jgi:hypothetical protein
LESSKTVLESSTNSSILKNNNLKKIPGKEPNNIRKFHTSTRMGASKSTITNKVSGFIDDAAVELDSKYKNNKLLLPEYS